MKQKFSLKLSLKGFSFSFLPSQDQHQFSVSCLFLLLCAPWVIMKSSTDNLPPFLHPIQLLIPPSSCFLLPFSFFLSYLTFKIPIGSWLLPLTMSLTCAGEGNTGLGKSRRSPFCSTVFHYSSVLQSSSQPRLCGRPCLQFWICLLGIPECTIHTQKCIYLITVSLHGLQSARLL